MDWQEWQHILEVEVDAAAKLLSLEPISVAVNNSHDGPQTWVNAREITVGAKWLDAVGRINALFGTFHEVGHIFVAGRHMTPLTPHNLEKACDHVGGWLCCRRGLTLGTDETLAVSYGATILEAFANAPLHLRVAVMLGLDSGVSHPDGGSRATIMLAGWLEAKGGRSCSA